MKTPDDFQLTWHTSTTKKAIATVRNFTQFFEVAKERAYGFKDIFTKKIGKDIVIIWTAPTLIFEWMGKSMQILGYDVRIIKKDDWDKPIDLPNGKKIVFIGWWSDNPIIDWIKKGIIRKEHYFLSTLKNEEEKKFCAERTIFIDFWTNAQLDGGLKFPDCDRYHMISHAIVSDPDNEFIRGKDDCSCGVKGETFIVKSLK